MAIDELRKNLNH